MLVVDEQIKYACFKITTMLTTTNDKRPPCCFLYLFSRIYCINIYHVIFAVSSENRPYYKYIYILYGRDNVIDETEL